MSNSQGPQTCCTQQCNQGRTCSALCTVNTDEESPFDWVAALLIGTLFFFGLLAAVGVVMAAFYIFWG